MNKLSILLVCIAHQFYSFSPFLLIQTVCRLTPYVSFLLKWLNCTFVNFTGWLLSGRDRHLIVSLHGVQLVNSELMAGLLLCPQSPVWRIPRWARSPFIFGLWPMDFLVFVLYKISTVLLYSDYLQYSFNVLTLYNVHTSMRFLFVIGVFPNVCSIRVGAWILRLPSRTFRVYVARWSSWAARWRPWTRSLPSSAPPFSIRFPPDISSIRARCTFCVLEESRIKTYYCTVVPGVNWNLPACKLTVLKLCHSFLDSCIGCLEGTGWSPFNVYLSTLRILRRSRWTRKFAIGSCSRM